MCLQRLWQATEWNARHSREAARIKQLVALLKTDAVRSVLSAEPHPVEWRAEQGATLSDWVDWMVENAGTSGKLKVARKVEAIAKQVSENSTNGA